MKGLIFLYFLLMTLPGWARPSGADVKSGQVSFQSIDAALEVYASDRSIIHWEDFSIQKDEVMRFIQPGASSVVLNRVTGLNASMIHGVLEANGRVVLINPNAFQKLNKKISD
jgi:filamentous hemagglutinin family protein